MPNPYFQFKQFKIEQTGAAMKVGTDGVLLGAWAPVDGCRHVLDVGTGTGLLALMAAQRNQFAVIDAVEIEPNAVCQATQNVLASNWADRINVHGVSYQQFADAHPAQYDLVICNPPFFANSLQAPSKERNFARHNDTLTLPDFVSATVSVLNLDGKCAVVLPCDGVAALKNLFELEGLRPHKWLTVYPGPRKQAKRVLAVFGRQALACEYTELIVEQNGRHNYSDDYKSLTRDFYLMF